MTALFPSTYTGRSVLNDMPPLTVVVVAAATSTDAASAPLALKTWIFPDAPIAGRSAERDPQRRIGADVRSVRRRKDRGSASRRAGVAGARRRRFPHAPRLRRRRRWRCAPPLPDAPPPAAPAAVVPAGRARARGSARRRGAGRSAGAADRRAPVRPARRAAAGSGRSAGCALSALAATLAVGRHAAAGRRMPRAATRRIARPPAARGRQSSRPGTGADGSFDARRRRPAWRCRAA